MQNANTGSTSSATKDGTAGPGTDGDLTANGTNTQFVYGTDQWLYREPVLKSHMAEKLVKVGDEVRIDVIAYDSRSGITDKPNEVVADGIRKYMAQKPIRYRHVDPNDDAHSMMGQAGSTVDISHKIDNTGNTYMEIVVPLEFKARSQRQADILTDMIDRAKMASSMAEKTNLMGVSLGWVETNDEFVPHEISVTPEPRCGPCRQVPGSEQIASASAESNGEKTMTDDKNLDKQELIDLHVDNKQKDSEITSLKAELATARTEFDTKLTSKIAEVNMQKDKELVERQAELDKTKELLSEAETKLQHSTTYPIRAAIAGMMGHKKDSEGFKNVIESYSSTDEKVLQNFKASLEQAAKVAVDNANSLEQTDAFLPTDEIMPNIAENNSLNNLSDEQLITKMYGKDFVDGLGSQRGRN